MTPIYTATNEDDGVSAHVFMVASKVSYLVRLHDNDSGQFLPPHVWFDTKEQAQAYADKCANLKVEG